MRAVLMLPTGSVQVTEQMLLQALETTTWLPADRTSEWSTRRTEQVLGRLPDEIAEQVRNAPHSFIQVGLSVHGMVSLERTGAVIIRLGQIEGEGVEPIKAAVEQVADKLPDALAALPEFGGETPELDSEIEIRQDRHGATTAKGRIVTPHRLRFWSYLRHERRREWVVVRSLAAVLVLCFGVDLALAAVDSVPKWEPLTRGYLERGASAVAVAILTMLINLMFEHRDWRSEKTEVQWIFG